MNEETWWCLLPLLQSLTETAWHQQAGLECNSFQNHHHQCAESSSNWHCYHPREDYVPYRKTKSTVRLVQIKPVRGIALDARVKPAESSARTVGQTAFPIAHPLRATAGTTERIWKGLLTIIPGVINWRSGISGKYSHMWHSQASHAHKFYSSGRHSARHTNDHRTSRTSFFVSGRSRFKSKLDAVTESFVILSTSKWTKR